MKETGVKGGVGVCRLEPMKSNVRKRMETSVGQEESCRGVIEEIKDGGVKTFSFIAAWGGVLN